MTRMRQFECRLHCGFFHPEDEEIRDALAIALDKRIREHTVGGLILIFVAGALRQFGMLYVLYARQQQAG